MGTTLGRIFLSLFTLLFIVPILLVRCQPRAEGGTGILVRLHRVDQRRTYIMDLEEYLKGVVAAEMPAAFHPEALKAQAVAARTVTVRRLLRYGGKGSKYDPSADFSDDPVEGQAWLSQRDLRRRWGWRAYSANWAKVSRAVEETKGLILTYQGRPIDAVYHSTSGPRTEAAQDVWGRAVPYLQSVACPYDRHSPRYRQTVRFTPGELARRLGVRLPGQGVAGTLPVATGGQGVQVLERSSGGAGQVDPGRGRYLPGRGIPPPARLAFHPPGFMGEQRPRFNRDRRLRARGRPLSIRRGWHGQARRRFPPDPPALLYGSGNSAVGSKKCKVKREKSEGKTRGAGLVPCFSGIFFLLMGRIFLR